MQLKPNGSCWKFIDPAGRGGIVFQVLGQPKGIPGLWTDSCYDVMFLSTYPTLGCHLGLFNNRIGLGSLCEEKAVPISKDQFEAVVALCQ